MSIVLVTGAAGFIGSNLCRRLLDYNYEVIAVDNLRYGQFSSLLPYLNSNESFEFHNLDVRSKKMIDLIKRSNVILPMACLVGAPVCDQYPEEAEQVNVNAILNMLDYVNGQRIVFPNTNSGYGIMGGEEICTEDSPLTPISIYGKQKCEAENAVLGYKNGVSVRLATNFGVGVGRQRLDLLVNNLAYKAFFDKKLVIYEPHFRRNFIHVKDAVEGIIHLIDNGVPGFAYNCGNDDCNMTKLQLAQKIGEFIETEIEVGEGEDTDKRDYIVSSERLYSSGFEPRYSLEDGIKELRTLFSVLSKDSENRKMQIRDMFNVKNE